MRDIDRLREGLNITFAGEGVSVELEAAVSPKAPGMRLLLVMAVFVTAFLAVGEGREAVAGESRWGVVEDNGVWWLLTPGGERFFSVGVNVVTGGSEDREFRGRTWYSWPSFYPRFDLWLLATRVRLRDWGFNTAGGWSQHPQELKIPVTPELDLGRLSRFHWYDPFHPATGQRMAEMAKELVAPYKGSPYRIGYFSDNEVGWWNGPLFVYYIQKPATNHTKRKLVELLREHYGGDWQRFLEDFQVPKGVRSFQELASTGGTDVLMRPGGQGIRVVRRWAGIIAEHYYRTVREALRWADPDALVLGDRLPIYYDPDALRAMVPHVDVISVNYNVDSPDGWLARYFFEGLRDLAGTRPVIISEWFFAAEENRTGNRNLGHLMTVSSQTERAKGAVMAAQRFAKEPQIVGIHWFQYWDQPKGGRLDGEDYNFGLVDVDDRPYEELVEGFKRVNPTLKEIHAKARAFGREHSGWPFMVPRASIDATDRHLGEWPKEIALLPRLRAPAPEIPFGDLYMAWDERALHLAMIAMDYQDPELLAYEGEFPLGEAFRLDWGLEGGRGVRRFRLYVLPPPKREVGKDTYRMNLKLCALDHGSSCRPVPGAVSTYFGSDQPRIVVELSLPWEAIGLDGPPLGRLLRTEVAVTAFYGSRWMSSSGLAPEISMEDLGSWRHARLVDGKE